MTDMCMSHAILQACRNRAVCVKLQNAYTSFCLCPADDIAWDVTETFLQCNFLSADWLQVGHLAD